MVVQEIKYMSQGEEQSTTYQWLLWLAFSRGFYCLGVIFTVYCQRKRAQTHIYLSKVWFTRCNLSAHIYSCTTKQCWEQLSPQTKPGTLSLALRNWGDPLNTNFQHWGSGTPLSRCSAVCKAHSNWKPSHATQQGGTTVLQSSCKCAHTHTTIFSIFSHISMKLNSLPDLPNNMPSLELSPSRSKPKGKHREKALHPGYFSPFAGHKHAGQLPEILLVTTALLPRWWSYSFHGAL